ncbi:MAG: GCN5-related N-acetyltransferase [Solirubrobacterales bacterium]|nr:GCN5-related N-acetyltransferase [Solirubrobacterales bacterium]
MDLDLRRLTLRPATAADEPFFREAHRGAYRDVVERQFGSFDVSLQDAIVARLGDPGFFLVLREGAEAGFVRFEQTSDALVVDELVVDPAVQGTGVGTELLRAVQEWAAARELPVVLEVLRENRAARLYRRLGFEPCGESPTHVSMRWHHRS